MFNVHRIQLVLVLLLSCLISVSLVSADEPLSHAALRVVAQQDDGPAVEVLNSIGGQVTASDLGPLAIIAQGTRLLVIDMNAQPAPKTLGQLILPNKTSSIAVQGQYAYITLDEWNEASTRMIIVDLTTPQAPVLRGMIAFALAAKVAHVDGPYAYVIEPGQGLVILDVQQPDAPRRIGSFATQTTISEVAFNGKIAYVAAGSFQIVNMADPAKPEVLGSYTSGAPNSAIGSTVTGTTAYFAFTGCFKASCVGWIDVVDVSNPSAPVKLGGMETAQTGSFEIVRDVAGTVAYTNYGGMFDITDAKQPVLLGTIEGINTITSRMVDIKVVDQRLFVMRDSYQLMVFDVAIPSQPRLISKQLADPAINRVVNGGTRAYVMRGAWATPGIQSIDLADPMKPVFGAPYSNVLPDNSFVARGAMVYIAKGLSGIDIVDYTDPFSPTLRGTFATNDVFDQVEILDDVLYASSERDRKLYVLDVSDPAHPKALGEPILGSIRDIAVRGGLAYHLGEEFLTMFDVADDNLGRKRGAIQLASIGDSFTPSAVRLIGDVAYVTGTQYTYTTATELGHTMCWLKVVDVRNPDAPTMAASFTRFGYFAASIYDHQCDLVVGENAYIAAGDGVYHFDVSDPLKPALRGRFPLIASKLQAVGDLQYAISPGAGLLVLRIHPERFADILPQQFLPIVGQ